MRVAVSNKSVDVVEIRARLLAGGEAVTDESIAVLHIAPENLTLWDERNLGGSALVSLIADDLPKAEIAILKPPVVNDGIYAVEVHAIAYLNTDLPDEHTLTHRYYEVAGGTWFEISAVEYDERTITWAAAPSGEPMRQGDLRRRTVGESKPGIVQMVAAPVGAAYRSPAPGSEVGQP